LIQHRASAVFVTAKGAMSLLSPGQRLRILIRIAQALKARVNTPLWS
jgi:hypothetical protein